MTCIEDISSQHMQPVISTNHEPPQYLIHSAKKTQYVYAIRREGFVGNTLYPLNQMKEMENYQNIYRVAIKKYEGRKTIMKTHITVLNCLWNDVIFLMPLHPHLMYRKLKEIGYNRKK
jgi:broad-specificity NMP kinase